MSLSNIDGISAGAAPQGAALRTLPLHRTYAIWQRGLGRETLFGARPNGRTPYVGASPHAPRFREPPPVRYPSVAPTLQCSAQGFSKRVLFLSIRGRAHPGTAASRALAGKYPDRDHPEGGDLRHWSHASLLPSLAPASRLELASLARSERPKPVAAPPLFCWSHRRSASKAFEAGGTCHPRPTAGSRSPCQKKPPPRQTKAAVTNATGVRFTARPPQVTASSVYRVQQLSRGRPAKLDRPGRV